MYNDSNIRTQYFFRAIAKLSDPSFVDQPE